MSHHLHVAAAAVSSHPWLPHHQLSNLHSTTSPLPLVWLPIAAAAAFSEPTNNPTLQPDWPRCTATSLFGQGFSSPTRLVGRGNPQSIMLISHRVSKTILQPNLCLAGCLTKPKLVLVRGFHSFQCTGNSICEKLYVWILLGSYWSSACVYTGWNSFTHAFFDSFAKNDVCKAQFCDQETQLCNEV